jgi:hypothetical protein
MAQHGESFNSRPAESSRGFFFLVASCCGLINLAGEARQLGDSCQQFVLAGRILMLWLLDLRIVREGKVYTTVEPREFLLAN